MQLKKLKKISVLMGLILSAGILSRAEAATDVKFSDVVKEVTIKGDLRLRHESFHRSDKNGTATANASNERDRHRQRVRLRLQTDFKLPNNLAAKFRFASGTGEQGSTNQSLDNLSNQKEFWIDRAYLEWAPGDTMRFAGGKIPNPLWVPYSGDILWDGDFNPEGASENFSFFGPFQTKIFINALQMVVDEDTSGTQDQAMFGQQLGIETLLFEESKFTFAAGLHEWVNERSSNFSPTNLATLPVSPTGSTPQDGNRRTSNVLQNEFRVAEYTGEFATRLFDIPISVMGTAIHNQKAMLTPDEDKGYQYGTIIGKANKAKALEFAYFYKRAETDATVADVADSDFGSSGGTNRKGHIMWGAFAPVDFMIISVKHFITKTLEPSLSPNVKPVNRTQVDFLVKF